MQESVVELAKKFIAIKSTEDNPAALRAVLELALANLEGYTIEKFVDQGAQSALIYNASERPSKFKIILNGHLDVVAGKDYQYNPVVKNGKLYGVGALDMKSNIACLITAFKAVANKISYPLALQIVTDEEIGGFHGTMYQVNQGVKADFVIAGETTNFDIAHKARGILWLKITAKGKTAHGAYPWRGENAIWKMVKFLSRLEKVFPIPKQQGWETTLNLSQIETSNQAYNKIPDDCTVFIDIRYIPEDSEILIDKVKQLLPNDFELEVVTKEPSMFVAEDNPYLQKLKTAAEKSLSKGVKLYGAQGSSDARHYTRIGTPGVEFGAIGGGIGTDEEWIEISSLIKYTQILKDFLKSVQS